MQDQLVMAIATALATKGAEALASGGKSALGALFRLIRKRFGEGTSEAATLDTAVARSDDARRAELAAALARALAADPDFEARVESLWREAATELSADRGGVINHFSGTADRVVQARDIHGGLSL